MAEPARRIRSEVHDEPHLEGRRVTVRRLQGLVEGAGLPADAVADQFDIGVADVYAALQYFHTHPEEMAAVARRRRDREAAAQEAGATSLGELRQNHGEESHDVSDSG